MAELILTKENFDSEVNFSKYPILIDFWAPWCAPCRMLAPIITQIAEEFEGKIKVARINVDEEPEIAARFSVFSIPTLVLVKYGSAVASAIGFRSKSDIIDTLGLKAAAYKFVTDKDFE